MTTQQAPDLRPEFEGLVLASSALMLEAKAHKAEGKPFEAAIDWNQAGRKLLELSRDLLRAGYSYEGAQDYLNAIECFLHSGDARLCEQVIREWSDSETLAAIDEDEGLCRRFAELRERIERKRRDFERLRQEMREQMKDASGAPRLPKVWLQNAWKRFPGLPDFHFFAAQKFLREGRSVNAVLHMDICARLVPENPAFWTMRAFYTELVGSIQAAVRAWDEARRHHPSDPLILLGAAWIRCLAAFKRGTNTSQLGVAETLIVQALETNQLSPRESVLASCILALVLRRKNQHADARKRLEQIDRDFPMGGPNLDLVWKMLRGEERVDTDLRKRMREMLEATAA